MTGTRTFEYRKITGELVGPITEEELRAELESGSVSHLTSARSSAEAMWRSLREVLDLGSPPPAVQIPARPIPRSRGLESATRDPIGTSPQPSGASAPVASLRSISFINLDPVLRSKRRLLLFPNGMEAIWSVSILFAIPSLSFVVVFASLAIAALAFERGSDPLLMTAVAGSAIVIFCLYAIVWILPLGVISAIKRDAEWALLVMMILGAAAAAAILGSAPESIGVVTGGLVCVAAIPIANSLAHLLYLRNRRRDPVFGRMFRQSRRGLTMRPTAGAMIGVVWDLGRAMASVVLVGCVVALVIRLTGPYALLFYIFALAVLRRPVSRRFIAAVNDARGRLQRSVDRKIDAEVDDPILFLRSFSDDVIRTESFGTKIISAVFGVELESTRLEDSIVAAVGNAAPLIAIARPGTKRTTLGAARQRLTDEEWQTVVSNYIGKAICIILVQGKTDGLGWELSEVRRQTKMHKLIMIVPPNRGAGMEDVVRAWVNRPNEAVPRSFIGVAPPLAVIEGRSNGSLEACIASRLDAEAYRLSTRFCLNRVLERVAPSPPAKALASAVTVSETG